MVAHGSRLKPLGFNGSIGGISGSGVVGDNWGFRLRIPYIRQNILENAATKTVLEQSSIFRLGSRRYNIFDDLGEGSDAMVVGR